MKYLSIVSELVLEGNSIIRVELGVGEFIYINATNYQPPESNTVGSIDYFTVTGVDITDFLTKNFTIDRNQLISMFDALIEKKDNITLKTSGYNWIIFE